MKNLSASITIVALLAAMSLCAQAQERTFAKADVPFAFAVKNVDLPAGTYTVSVLPPYNMIKVQSIDGRKTAMVSAMPSQRTEESQQTKLVFNHVGGHYFLIQVWEQGSNVRRDLPSGNLARELAKSGEKVQSATILARR
jgi:hypothetical protein